MAAPVRARHVPETRDPAATGQLDFRGVILAAVGLAGITYALIEAPGQGASPPVLAAGVGGITALTAFLSAERGAAPGSSRARVVWR
jgi:hypothetical protein